MVTAADGMTYPQRFGAAEAAEFCLRPDGCLRADPTSPIALLLWASLLALFVAAALVHLRNAGSLLEEERSRTREERDAFDAFARTVAEIEASAAGATHAMGAVAVLDAGTSDGRLERVEDAYRETVMAVDHYEEEYDEPLPANMAAELSEELAAAVADGDTLTPTLKQALVEQATQARTRREEFLGQLDREAEDIAALREEFDDIEGELDAMNATALSERSFDDLIAAWDRLGTLEERCRKRLADRQERIHERDAIRRTRDLPFLQAYLYRSLPVTFPALAAGTELLDTVRTARRRVARAVSRQS